MTPQVIYPDSYSDMVSRSITDDNLRELLGRVQLTHILDRECGWDAMADWMDVLSGGEKQRIAVGVDVLIHTSTLFYVYVSLSVFHCPIDYMHFLICLFTLSFLPLVVIGKALLVAVGKALL